MRITGEYLWISAAKSHGKSYGNLQLLTKSDPPLRRRAWPSVASRARLWAPDLRSLVWDHYGPTVNRCKTAWVEVRIDDIHVDILRYNKIHEDTIFEKLSLLIWGAQHGSRAKQKAPWKCHDPPAFGRTLPSTLDASCSTFFWKDPASCTAGGTSAASGSVCSQLFTSHLPGLRMALWNLGRTLWNRCLFEGWQRHLKLSLAL